MLYLTVTFNYKVVEYESGEPFVKSPDLANSPYAISTFWMHTTRMARKGQFN